MTTSERVHNIFVPCIRCARALLFDVLKGEKPDPKLSYLCRECWEAAWALRDPEPALDTGSAVETSPAASNASE